MQSPRIQVSLEDGVYRSISRIAAGTGVSRSALVADMVSINADLLVQFADIIEQVNSLSEAVRARLEPDLFSAEVATQQALDEARGRLDELQRAVLEELKRMGVRDPVRASGAAEGGAGGGAQGALPPSTNKGANQGGGRGQATSKHRGGSR